MNANYIYCPFCGYEDFDVFVMSEIHQCGKRLVMAPDTNPLTNSGDLVSVWIQPNEKVEWIWTINSDGGRRVTGYRIIKSVIA